MSRGATARLFVAVEPPLSAREQLADWARGVAAGVRGGGGSASGLRLLDVQLLHLTLCFLGSRPVGEIDALADAVRSCVSRVIQREGENPLNDACELSVGAPLWLPPRRPRALAVEIHDRGGALGCLHERITRGLSSVSSWEPERRRFRPHITLARVRSGGVRRRGFERASFAPPGCEQLLPVTPRLDFLAQEIVLYRSWLAPDGASYEALARGSARLGWAACGR